MAQTSPVSRRPERVNRWLRHSNLQRIVTNPTRGPSALILAPTRELAAQIADEIRVLQPPLRSRASRFMVVGKALKAKPVRTRTSSLHAQTARPRPRTVTGGIRTLVLDEADHMFDMGFVLSAKSSSSFRETVTFFSATMPKKSALADEMLDQPTVAELPSNSPVDLIEQVVYPVHDSESFLLEHLLNNDGVSRAIIFTRTKRRAKTLADKPVRPLSTLHLSRQYVPNARDRAINDLRVTFDILVATDIAARGIDVSKVSHDQLRCADTPEAYTHRIGRTGRAQCTGKAYLYRDGRPTLRAIEDASAKPFPSTDEEFMKYDGPATPAGTPRGGQQRPQKKPSPDARAVLKPSPEDRVQMVSRRLASKMGTTATRGWTAQETKSPSARRRRPRRRKPTGGARPTNA